MDRAIFSFAVLTGLLLATSLHDVSANEALEATSLRVAVAQIPVSRDIAANQKTIERAINWAVEQKAEVLLTPEGSLSGYTPMPDPHLSQQLAAMGAKVIFHAVNGGRSAAPWSQEVY